MIAFLGALKPKLAKISTSRNQHSNDNEFLAQDGFQVGAPYKAEDGADVDSMFLVYQVTLAGLAKK